MSHRPWPSNPRDANNGNFATATHYLAVTLFLIAISAVVAALTQFGSTVEKADVLFMSSQQRYQAFEKQREEYRELLERRGFEPVDGGYGLGEGKAPVSPEQLRELDVMSKDLLLAAARLKDPLADIKRGQVWRLVTPMFVHFGILHLAFNMMWLWQFGVVLEMRFRWLRFLGLVLVVAALSNLAQGLWKGTSFGGMSGVNYGLFGFLLLRSKLHPSPEFVMHSRTVSLMLIWLVVCYTGVIGPVANTAHLVGFLAGGAIGAANALMAGGWKILQRRQRFRSSLAASAECLHHCATCGQTERSAPELDFFVSQHDHLEYCSIHLPENRGHGTAPEVPPKP